MSQATGIEVLTDDGLRLVADRVGEGPAVVLVHGLGFSRSRWKAQTLALAANGYCAITYDLRGFGESEPPTGPYGMEVLVADLETVRRAMDLEHFHLVGHSLGGMVSQRYVLENPQRVRSLTLASSTSHSGNRGSAYGAALAHLCELGFDEAMKDDDFRSKIEFAVFALSDPEVRKELDGTLSDELPTGEELLALIRRMTPTANPARAYGWRCTVGFTTKAELDRITCPTLVMHGRSDMIIPYVAGELTRKALGSRWRGFPGAGHNLPHERADEFNTTLLEFLADAEKQ